MTVCKDCEELQKAHNQGGTYLGSIQQCKNCLLNTELTLALKKHKDDEPDPILEAWRELRTLVWHMHPIPQNISVEDIKQIMKMIEEKR